MQLHRKFAGDGLVVMSLDIIQDEWGEKDKVLRYLTGQEAKFPNYIFKDRPQKVDDWLERYDAFAVPAWVVFDRQGKRVVVPTLKTPEDEEAFVTKLLAK